MTDRREIMELIEKVNGLPMRQAWPKYDGGGRIDSVRYQNLLRPEVEMPPIAFAEMARSL